MCEYCEDRKVIVGRGFLDTSTSHWCGQLKSIDAKYSDWIVFIDRGFVRFAQKDDCDCIDHGERFKINYCPICGKKMEDII